jgi:hypothetical protein
MKLIGMLIVVAAILALTFLYLRKSESAIEAVSTSPDSGKTTVEWAKENVEALNESVREQNELLENISEP